ncbi:fumarate hydratase [Candidatus Omnitrophota bacterium]
MRTVKAKAITEIVKGLCIKANIELRRDVVSALKIARHRETDNKARDVLGIIIDNAMIAKKKRVPICQDTGMAIVYLKIGQGVIIKGNIDKAVEKGIGQAYRDGYFRKSIVKDPLIRKNTNTNLPAITHAQIVPGNKIDIRVAIKGFGCENAGRTRMFRPTTPASLIEDFVVDIVKELGSSACPPMYIGIGIGGTLDKAVELSKEAIFRKVDKRNKKTHIARLEKDILKKVNKLRIGPMGMGGDTTILGVSILTYPTHIAGLPVAVNISCHATRDARKAI